MSCVYQLRLPSNTADNVSKLMNIRNRLLIPYIIIIIITKRDAHSPKINSNCLQFRYLAIVRLQSNSFKRQFSHCIPSITHVRHSTHILTYMAHTSNEMGEWCSVATLLVEYSVSIYKMPCQCISILLRSKQKLRILNSLWNETEWKKKKKKKR